MVNQYYKKHIPVNNMSFVRIKRDFYQFYKFFFNQAGHFDVEYKTSNFYSFALQLYKEQ